MARLNVETSLWTNPRFQKFMIRIGDRHKAIGMVVDLWTLAQQHWCPKRELIPVETWTEAGLSDELIECGLAERRDEGIYARGSESNFQWWFDGIEQRKNAGLKSAQARVKKFGTAQPPNGKQTHGTKSNDDRTGVQLESNGIEPSSSPSPYKDKNTYIFNFDSALAEYRQLPGVQKGSKAEKRFQDQVKAEGDLERLINAIRNYRTFLSWPENSWRKPKTSFESFLGSKSSGFYWLDFIKMPNRGSSTPAARAEMEF